MESLKKPEMILALADAIGIIALAVHNYRELEKLKGLIHDMTGVLAKLSQNLETRPRSENLKDLHTLIQQQEKTSRNKWSRLDTLADAIDHLEGQFKIVFENIAAIAEGLKSSDINISLKQAKYKAIPKLNSRQVRGRGNRYAEEELDEEDFDDEDDEPPVRPTRGGRRNYVDEDEEVDRQIRRRRP